VLNIVIVEDNPSVQKVLIFMLSENFKDINILAIGNNVKEGLEILYKNKPQLLFLDVEMPDGSGFDLLKKLRSITYPVIFITAHEKYALNAIKFSAQDFLLKPIDEEDLVDAVNKARLKVNENNSNEKIKVLLQNLNQPEKSFERIILNDKYGIEIVEVKDIIRLESSGNYTMFYTTDRDNPITVSKGIKSYETMLDESIFFRSHQSHIINLNYLTRYDKQEGGALILKDGSSIPLANRKRDALIKILNSM